MIQSGDIKDNKAITRLLRRYFAEGVTTRDEERILSKRIQSGRRAEEQLRAGRGDRDRLVRRIARGREAKCELAERNAAWGMSRISKYRGQGVPVEDLAQHAMLGLYRAAELFDWKRGTKFITYADWYIKLEMRRAIPGQGSTIAVGLSVYQRLIRDDGEMSKAEQATNEQARLARSTVSLDAPISSSRSGDPIMLAESAVCAVEDAGIAAFEAADEAAERGARVKAMLAILPGRELKVIRMSYGLGCDPATLDEIGAEIGVSRERVRQLREKALACGIRHVVAGPYVRSSYLAETAYRGSL